MTQCNQCGNCCEEIYLNTTKTFMRNALRKIGKARLAPKASASAVFILKHWTGHRTDAGWRYSCDAFDPVSRQCTAHKDRPPICSDYPWYGGPASAGQLIAEGPEKMSTCSFWLDVAKKDRPEWAVPVTLRTRRAVASRRDARRTDQSDEEDR